MILLKEKLQIVHKVCTIEPNIARKIHRKLVINSRIHTIHWPFGPVVSPLPQLIHPSMRVWFDLPHTN